MMVTFNVDQIEVDPVVGLKGKEFTFRFTVTRTSGTAQSVDFRIEVNLAAGWLLLDTQTTAGGTIEVTRKMYAPGARRVRITASYPAVKLTGETRKNFTVLPVTLLTFPFMPPLAICEPCSDPV